MKSPMLAGFILLAAGLAGKTEATPLSDAAEALQPGQWAELSTVNLTSSLIFRDGYSIFDFSDEMLWDPVLREAHFIGAGHQVPKHHIVYSETLNAWTERPFPGALNPSHTYDHQALDGPGRRLFHWIREPELRVHIYNLDTKTWDSGGRQIPNYPSITLAVEWFPELNRLFVSDPDSNNYLWDPATNTWNRFSGGVAGVGDYHNFARYSPIDKVVIFGGGETGNCCNQGSSGLHRLNQNQTITRLSNAPHWMGILHSSQIADPASGKFLVMFSNGSFQELDALTDTWRTLPQAPAGVRSNAGMAVTAISNYGVTMWLSHGGSGGSPRVHLYKHAPGSGTVQPTINLAASPTTVAVGGTTNLTWSTTNANACTASGGWSGTKATSGNEAIGPLAATTTFTLVCTNTGGGSATRGVNVTVQQATPPPTANLNANPTQIASGQSSVLDWSSTNAAACNASGGWAGAKATQGSQTVGPLQQTTSYSLTCTGAGGSIQDSVTVTVGASQAPPTVTLTANPATVASGSTSTLTWNSANATGCTASGGWTGTRATSGTQVTAALTANTTYTLSCIGAGGTTQRSATVTVQAGAPAPTITFSASPTSVAMNGTTMLTWTTTNATACTASGVWSGNKATSGSESSAPLTTASTFSLQCTGGGGTDSESVSVSVTGQQTTPSDADSGGGAFGLPALLALGGVLLARLRRRGALLPALMAAALAAIAPAHAADVTDVTIVSTTSGAQTNVPVTFGHVFKSGDISASAPVTARLASGTVVPVQVDRKTAYANGSLKHGVLTMLVPSLGGNAATGAILVNTGTGPSGGAIALSALLATSFDTTVTVNLGGVNWTASARSLLSSGTPPTWLSGPLATEWLVSGPLRDGGGAAHAHLSARFHVRAYQGLGAVRVEVVVENAWAMEAGPRGYTYNTNIDVAGRGTVFSEANVRHWTKARWRRVAWWGSVPSVDVRHNSQYFQATGAVPTYDPRVTMLSSALDQIQSRFNSNSSLMDIGVLNPDMAAGGGRTEIAPLPGFTAAYVISQDLRAKRSTVGHGEQGGAWPMHYRDKNTDRPISVDTHPQATIIGGNSYLPRCTATCPADRQDVTPEPAHHPSLAYVPYLVTGDYYHLEELQFWGNWVLFYGRISGRVTWDQIRGQAWGMRTLGQTAYATPDADPLKGYFTTKLQNNITYYLNNRVNPSGQYHTALGYITNNGDAAWLGYPAIMSTWMDDFFTWAIGHVVALGYTEARPILEWKAKFPVGRLTHPDMCWVMASTYWPYVRDDRYLGGTGQYVSNWRDWKVNMVYGDESFPLDGDVRDYTGQEQALINSACASTEMYNILGISRNCMVGYTNHESYSANMQPAVAVAVEAGVTNAQAAFDRLTSQACYPLSDYREEPQWAVYPSSAVANLPVINLSADPATVTSGGSTTLTWSTTNATTCTASGAWSGNKALSGTQPISNITATSTFGMQCTGANGSSTREVIVTLSTPGNPTLTLSANPTSVIMGGNSTLTWQSGGVTTCTASGGWTGSKALSGSQSVGPINANTTYTLACSGTGGNITRNVTVNVPATPPAPTVSISVNPAVVASGATTTITWSSTNATSCTASNGWTGTRASSGSQVSPAITAARTFTLTCTGPGGSANQSATVNLQGQVPAPTVTLAATPATVSSGASATLNWSSTNATSCTASGGWTGSKATSGSESTGALTQAATYTLSCTGSGGTGQASATVDVSGAATEPDEGGGGALGWLSLGALALVLRRRRVSEI